MDFSGYRARTRRMLLRPYRPADLEAFHDLHRRDEVARYLPWEPRDRVASRVALLNHLRPMVTTDGDHVTLAAEEHGSGRLVGEFVMRLRSTQHRRGELGYILHPDFGGRGLATEGARHMLHVAFALLHLRRVVARTYAENAASARVLLKLGMRHEAHLRQNELVKGEWVDEYDFAILRDEWARTTTQAPGGPPYR